MAPTEPAADAKERNPTAGRARQRGRAEDACLEAIRAAAKLVAQLTGSQEDAIAASETRLRR